MKNARKAAATARLAAPFAVNAGCSNQPATRTISVAGSGHSLSHAFRRTAARVSSVLRMGS